MGVEIRWFGHATFTFSDGAASVLVDPFFKENPACGEIPADLRADVILISHAHWDHLGDAAEIARQRGIPIVGTPEVTRLFEAEGVKVEKMNLGGNLDLGFASVRGSVKMVPAFHTSGFPGDGREVGVPVGYVIRLGGLRIYFAGDTCIFSDMKLFAELEGGIDVACLPIGDRFTMGITEAARAVELIKPRIVIPMHYNTWPRIQQDPQQFRQRVEGTGTRCLILAPGQAATVD